MNAPENIQFTFEGVDIAGFDTEKTRKRLMDVLTYEDARPGMLHIIFCDDDFLVDINKRYLDHHDYTDVITFDYGDEYEGTSGDIFISYPMVKENARKYDAPEGEELLRVMIHGLLHLLGYNDKEEADRLQMKAKENYYLSLLS